MNDHFAPLGPTPVPSGLTEFALPTGQRFSIDLTEASRELNRISKAHEHSENGEHLDAWAQWFLQRAGVQLIPSQAEWFWEYVMTERARAQQNFLQTLNSLSSTGSTPSG